MFNRANIGWSGMRSKLHVKLWPSKTTYLCKINNSKFKGSPDPSQFFEINVGKMWSRLFPTLISKMLRSGLPLKQIIFDLFKSQWSALTLTYQAFLNLIENVDLEMKNILWSLNCQLRSKSTSSRPSNLTSKIFYSKFLHIRVPKTRTPWTGHGDSIYM